MFYSDDPVQDFNRQDMEKARREERLPVCDDCKKRIYEEDYYNIDGDILCEECMKLRYQRNTEDFVDAYK